MPMYMFIHMSVYISSTHVHTHIFTMFSTRVYVYAHVDTDVYTHELRRRTSMAARLYRSQPAVWIDG